MVSMNRKESKSTLIFTNPVGWARWIGNSPFHVFIWFLIHSLFIAMGLWFIYDKLVITGFEPQKAFDVLKPSLFPILFVGVYFPVLYAYAIYRLLKIIDKKSEA